MCNKVEYEYDICLTYASEQLDYVQKVYEVLCANNVRVFFDRDNDIDTFLWGRNLIEAFQDVYKNKAHYCAMFISEDYAKKAWTKHERRSAFSRSINTGDIYILPIRFDETVVPGLDDSISYMNAQKIGPEDLANKIIKKIGLPSKDYTKSNLFTKEDATEQLFHNIVDIIDQYSSSMYVVNHPTSIQMFKNIDCANNSEYGAYVYCIEGGNTPKFKIVNMSIFDFGEIECTHDELVNLLIEVFLI